MIKRFNFKVFFLSIALTLVCVGIFVTGSTVIQVIDNNVYDTWLRARAKETPSSKIVLAVVDEKSLDKQGKWSWPRAKLGHLVEKLDEAGARVIAFDMFFPEPDEGSNDAVFAQAIQNAKAPVVLGYYFHSDPKEIEHVPKDSIPLREKAITRNKYLVSGPSHEIISQNTFWNAVMPEPSVPAISASGCRAGYINTYQDHDGSLRSIPAVITFNGGFYPPLSVMIAAAYLNQSLLLLDVRETSVLSIRIGDIVIPADGWGRIPVNYRYAPTGFNKISVTDILTGDVDKALVKNKIVIVGSTAVGLPDTCVTPIQNCLPGMFVHAFVADSILAGQFISIPDWAMGITLFGIIAVGLLSGLFLSLLCPMSGTIGVILLACAYTGVTYWLFAQAGLFISPVYPSLTACVILFVIAVVERALQERTHNKLLRPTIDHDAVN